MKHDWQEQSLCAQIGSEVFFPEKGEANLTRAAKKVCARCEVSEECLDYALSLGRVQGVWGGTTERERGKMLRAREMAA